MSSELKKICERLRTINDQLLLVLKDLLDYEEALKTREITPPTPPYRIATPKIHIPHYPLPSYPLRYPPKPSKKLKVQGEIKQETK